MSVRGRSSGGIAIFCSAMAIAGCDHRRPTGDVALTVTVPSDTPVTEVDYALTGIGIPATTGSIQELDPSISFSRLISHVPTGDDYLAHVTAKSVDGQRECDGMATADVRPQVTTVLNVALSCHDVGGHIAIAVDGAVCPSFQVMSYTVSPLSASVGQQIAVSETTTDTDGDPISFLWTAPTGSFDTPTDSATMYTCAQPGVVILTGRAMTGACKAVQAITVNCVGDGGVD